MQKSLVSLKPKKHRCRSKINSSESMHPWAHRQWAGEDARTDALKEVHARCLLRRTRAAEHNGKLGSGRDMWVACVDAVEGDGQRTCREPATPTALESAHKSHARTAQTAWSWLSCAQQACQRKEEGEQYTKREPE
jgi:hypothetical protein